MIRYCSIFFGLIICWGYLACNKPSGNKANSAFKLTTHEVPSIFVYYHKKKLIPFLKPVWGYRFQIEGDFNGDGRSETLTEIFWDNRVKKETNKFYNDITYDQLVEITVNYKDPFSFVISTDPNVDTLHISEHGQLLGLSYLKNEGDLDGNGTDEIGYVIKHADWSNLNHYNIVSYKNKKWELMYSFPIWDWQLPDLPSINTEYGALGLHEILILNEKDSLKEKQLVEFPGLVRKVRNHIIEIQYMDGESNLDTIVVDMRK